MTLPKKGSRDIRVGDKTFRWMVKRVPPEHARLTVEDPTNGEIRQRVFRGKPFDPPGVTPHDVQEFIREEFDGSC